MNDNNLPNDPLSADQFNIPGIVKYVIPQYSTDRTAGEQMPWINGDFIRCGSCDLPASISFNNQDQNQSVPLIGGMAIRGKFSSVTVWHDNYTASALARPQIILHVGHGTESEIDSQNSRTQMNTLLIPVYPGYKKLNFNWMLSGPSASAPGSLVVNGNFQAPSGQTLLPQGFSRNGQTYVGTFAQHFIQLTAPTLIVAGTYNWFFAGVDVPIPTNADRFVAIVNFNPALTANPTYQVSAFLS